MPTPRTTGELLLPTRTLVDRDNSLAFQRISLAQGLSQSVVTAIQRDELGFMWFGTQDGLNRYDGYEFVVYKHDPAEANSLANNFVSALLYDPDGTLWIGTNGGGLDRFDPRTGQFTHYRQDPADPDSLAHNVVETLLRDQEGNLWVGTGGGLDRFDAEKGHFVHYYDKWDSGGGLDHSKVNVVYQDRAGNLWVGTDGGGLDRLDPETGAWLRYHHDPADPSSLAYDDVQSLDESVDGALWVGTEGGGLDRFDPETGKFSHYRHDEADPSSLAHDAVSAILQDRAGVLWVGTDGGGLDRFDPETDTFVHHRYDLADPTSLSSDAIWTLYEDVDGALWAGTFGGGVNRLDGQGKKFALYQADPDKANSLSSNGIWSVYQDADGTLWVGTHDGGLNRLDPQTDVWHHYRHDPDNPASLASDTVWSILRDGAGRLWLGTGEGLDRFEEGTGTFVHYDMPPAFVIYQDRQGLLWFGTWGGGLGWADPDLLAEVEQTAKGEGVAFYQHDPDDPASLGGDSVVTIHQDRDGALWIGTFGRGLDRLNDPQSGRFMHYRHDPDDPASLSSDSVLSIHRDRDGVLWVATVGGGLNRFDAETETFHHYFEKDGLANDTVYGILEDELPAEEGGPSLWLSTNRGLSRLGLEDGTFRNYDVDDGLQSNEFNQGAYHRGPTGRIFVGGINGLSAFHPAQVKDNPAIPPVVLTALTQGGEAVAAGEAVEYLETLTLHWPHNFFEFEVAALDYAQAEKSRYAYMLEGFDEDWIEGGTRRFGRYTNLPGGTYTLRIKGSNGDGVWNEAGRVLTVEVVPPLWATWWFRGGLALLLVGTAIGVYRLRVNSIQAAAAVENARLYEDASARLAQLTALQETSRAVASTLDLDQLLELIIDQATTLLQGDGGIVNLVDWEGGEDEVVAASGSTASLVGLRSALDDSLSGWVARHNEPVITNQIQSDERTNPSALTWLTEKEIQCAVLAPLAAKDRVLGTLVVMGRRGGKREFTQADLDLLAAFGNQAATAIENAQLLEAERRRADELEALRTTLADVTAELELPSLLQAIVERSASLLGATGGEFGLYDEASQELRIAVSYNLGRDYVGTCHKLGEGVMGRVAQTGESVIIPDYQTWPGGLPLYRHVRGTLAAPLKVGGRLVGVFTTVTTDPERKFTPADLHLLDLFAQQAAIAIENARLYGQAQQLAVMEERQRLARDLHDSVTQALYGMTLYSEAAAQELALGQLDLVAEYLSELQDTARDAMAEMRLLIHELRPSILTEEGLVAALEARLQTVEGRSGLKTDFQVEMQGRLPPDIEEGLYRVAQEALNNALKHARASTVRISLRHAVPEGMAILKIADDGVGFDPASVRQEGGLGLSAMEERVAELGGRFSIGNGSGKGTRVQVEVPV
ncbi:MAG: two-component regulator propeller domain-containing protein [Anaerolineae bacterium]